MKKSTNFWSAFGKICVIILAIVFVGGMIATMISADSSEVIYPEYVASNGETTCPQAGVAAAHNKNNCSATVIDTVEPACATTGYTVYQCNGCGVYFMDDIIKALEGCVWGDEVVITPATCTADGLNQKTCSTHNYTEDIVVPTIGHNWSEWIPDGALCVDGGTTESRTCNTCGETEQRDAVPADHAWGAPVFNKVPTCDTAGEAIYTCGVCGSTKIVEVLPMTDNYQHDWEVVESIPGSCVESVNRLVCKLCGVEILESLGFANHDFYVFTRVEAKCGVEGYTIWQCANCTETYKEVHAEQFGDHPWQITPLEPTCTTYGHDFYFCPRCAETKTENVVEPYYHHLPTCEDHDACLKANNSIPCNMSDTGKGQLPTCLDAGTKIYACNECGAELTIKNSQGAGS